MSQRPRLFGICNRSASCDTCRAKLMHQEGGVVDTPYAFSQCLRCDTITIRAKADGEGGTRGIVARYEQRACDVHGAAYYETYGAKPRCVLCDPFDVDPIDVRRESAVEALAREEAAVIPFPRTGSDHS